MLSLMLVSGFIICLLNGVKAQFAQAAGGIEKMDGVPALVQVKIPLKDIAPIVPISDDTLVFCIN
ncbi:MAG: hypothetical protein HUU01_00170 [Saprospiraceae bacterium]|nr:hypothetical protein [Saprospiraceae bacterium]